MPSSPVSYDRQHIHAAYAASALRTDHLRESWLWARPEVEKALEATAVGCGRKPMCPMVGVRFGRGAMEWVYICCGRGMGVITLGIICIIYCIHFMLSMLCPQTLTAFVRIVRVHWVYIRAMCDLELAIQLVPVPARARACVCVCTALHIFVSLRKRMFPQQYMS